MALKRASKRAPAPKPRPAGRSGAGADIVSVLEESRIFEPPAPFAAEAHVSSLKQHRAMTRRANADPEAYWAALADSELQWIKPYKKVLEWKPPFARCSAPGLIMVKSVTNVPIIDL